MRFQKVQNMPCSLTLDQKNWSDDVYRGLIDFLKDKGKESPSHQGNEYAVFDFDNTCLIFDAEEQTSIYQIEHMAFVFGPEELDSVLASGIPDLDKDLTEYGYPGKNYHHWINDIHKAYSYLYHRYGPFTSAGIQDDGTLNQMHQDRMYLEFSSKMCALYSLVGEAEDKDVAYPWMTYWFTGMSEEEVYQLAYRSHLHYGNRMTEAKTWTSPESVVSEVGKASYSFTEGISVPEEIRDLMHCLNGNDIEVWICSASDINVIRAAIDAFQLHDEVCGVIGMTDALENGKYVNRYDYETGYAYLRDGEGWIKDTIASHAQIQREGKVTSIENILVPRYHHGPNIGFMDASGDFHFCSEFSELSMVVCFNRATRKVTDGGGLISEVAIYQKEHLNYDYLKAKENNDIYYVLQGRNENGLRSLRKSAKTIRLNQSEEMLFAEEKNGFMLRYFEKKNLSIEEILNRYCLRTDGDYEIGFRYGFLDKYNGYRRK